MATQSSLYNFGIDVSALNPGFKLIAADGFTLGSFTTTGMLTIDTKTRSISSLEVGTAIGIKWTCDTTALEGSEYFASPAVSAAAIAAAVRDVNNTSPAANSLGAAVNAAGGGSGSGAYTITVTVWDGTDLLQNATVRVTEGINTFTVVTDANGEGQFSLDAATYSVAVTKDGYTFTPTTRTVTGNEAGTLVNYLLMTAIVVPAVPSDPAKGTVYGQVNVSNGTTKAGYTATARLIGSNGYAGPFTWNGELILLANSDASDSSGRWSIEVPGTDGILPAGSQWLFTQPESGFSRQMAVLAGSSNNADA